MLSWILNRKEKKWGTQYKCTSALSGVDENEYKKYLLCIRSELKNDIAVS